MKRRTILRVGGAASLLLGLAGVGVALHRPALGHEGRLTDKGRALFGSIAAAVLDGMLPEQAAARDSAIRGHLQRIESTVAGFPPSVRAEIVELANLLTHPAGRLGLAGLKSDWASAPTTEVQAMLQALRESRLALRQQVYHALRDLTNGAYFADPGTWALVGYPGPGLLDTTAQESARA